MMVKFFCLENLRNRSLKFTKLVLKIYMTTIIVLQFSHMLYIKRFVESQITTLLQQARIVEVLGSRQVGKTTLLKHYAKNNNAKYVTLDDAVSLDFSINDAKAFIGQANSDLLIIDEIQRNPRLITELKRKVDDDNRPGQFIITGSADLTNLKTIHESLAGRAFLINLYGLSQDEIIGKQSNFINNIFKGKLNKSFVAKSTQENYSQVVAKGSYPEVVLNSGINFTNWYQNYLRLIFNRDAKDISELRRIADLPKILKYIASIVGSELVLSSMANDLDIPRTTLDPYVELLETLFIISRLESWTNNLTATVVKNKKPYIMDSGLATHLTKGKNAAGVFESFVISEIQKQLSFNALNEIKMYHYRDYEKQEIDLMLENRDDEVVLIEIKQTSTANYSDAKNIRKFIEKHSSKVVIGLVVYTGNKVVQIGKNIFVIPLELLWK